MKVLMKKSISAGLLIGLAAIAFTACAESRQVGALLFSFGLLVIAATGQYLYTGKIGSWNPGLMPFGELMTMLGVNLAAAFVTGVAAHLAKPGLIESAGIICMGRVGQSLIGAFLSACLCGCLVYLAIYMFNHDKLHPVVRMSGLILCVMVFVISGFDHCIANAAYFGLGFGTYPPVSALAVLVMDILGNSIGALLTHRVIR